MRKLTPWLLLAAFLWFYFNHYQQSGITRSNTVATPAPSPTAMTVTTTTEETTPAATSEAAAPAPQPTEKTAPAMEAPADATPGPSLSSTPSGVEGYNETRGGPAIEEGEGSKVPVATVVIPIILKADRDGDVNHCEGGRLQLKGPELHYDCPPPHEGKSVHLMVSEVRAVDKNGIELQTNKKYHFHVKDMSDAGVEQMFRNWLGAGIAPSGK